MEMSIELHMGAQLGIADLATILNDIYPCRAKWYSLGVQLRVDVGTLDCFKGQFGDPGDQLREVVRTWLTTSENPTWGVMAEALKCPIIEEAQLAKKLQQKYRSSGRSPVHEPLSRKALDVRMQVRTLQGNFASIATRASDQILEKNINAQAFRRPFMMQMDVSQKYEYQQFLECCLMKLEPGTTTDDLLCHMSRYWDFLNYGLLEHTVNVFGDTSLKQDMEGYIDKLRAFRVNTKLCDFIDNWPVRGQKPPKADFKEVVFKMEKNWEECTLEDIEKFKETLTHKFFLPNFVLLLREAKKGCVCLTWYTPAPIANAIQENLPNIETRFFKTHGIQRTNVGGQELRFSPQDTEVDRYAGSAGFTDIAGFNTSNATTQAFCRKLLMLSMAVLVLVVVTIEIVPSASEKHETIDTRGSNSSKKTNGEGMCHQTYGFVWMPLFFSLTFTSSLLSLEWLIFRTTKEIDLVAQLLGAIYVTVTLYAGWLGVWIAAEIIVGVSTLNLPSLWIVLATTETDVYFATFNIVRHYCKEKWWWKHCMSVLCIISCMCIIALVRTVEWQVFIAFVVSIFLCGGFGTLVNLCYRCHFCDVFYASFLPYSIPCFVLCFLLFSLCLRVLNF